MHFKSTLDNLVKLLPNNFVSDSTSISIADMLKSSTPGYEYIIVGGGAMGVSTT